MIWVCHGSHCILLNEVDELRRIGKDLKMAQVEIKPFRVFVGHGAVQNAGNVRIGRSRLRYHANLVPNGHEMK